MWREILRFEINYWISKPLFLITGTVLFVFALMIGSTHAGILFSHAPALAAHNAPYVTMHLMGGITVLGLFVVTAFVASSILRDFRLHTHPLFFSKPITARDYLLGRLSGSMIVSLALFVPPLAGLAVAPLMPWQQPDQVAPFSASALLAATLLIVLPNIVVMGVIFFALAATSRSLLVTYIGVVFYVGIQDVVQEIAKDAGNTLLGSIIEPLGVTALEATARYWTLTDYNTVVPWLSVPLLANRACWLGVGLTALLLVLLRFNYSRATARRWWTRRRPLQRSS